MDHQGWSDSDYASNSSNDINDYIGPLLPALISSSTSNPKQISRRIAATISLVESSLHRPKPAPGLTGFGRSRSLSRSQRHISSTTNFNNPVGRYDRATHSSPRHIRRVREPRLQQQLTSIPDSSSTSSTRGPDKDSDKDELQSNNTKHISSETDTIPDGGEKLNRLAEHYVGIRRKRSETKEIFSWLQNERVRLQDLRERRTAASHAFIAAAQAILPGNPGLGFLFKQMQDSQLAYDQTEQRLEDLIDQLEDGQLELELEERRFYSEAARPGNSLSSASSASSAEDSDSRSTLMGISGDRPEDIHPLFDELLEAFRDLQLSKEFWADLKMKKRAIEAKVTPDTIDLRQNFGDFERTKIFIARHYRLMSDEEVEFLQEYDVLEKRAISDIELYSNKARVLRKDCLERGVMPRNTPYREEGFGFDPFFRDDIRLADLPPGHDKKRPRTLEHGVFPILLSNPIHLLEAFPLTPQQSLQMANSLPPSLPTRQKFISDAAREYNIYSLIQDAEPEDKCDYINRWLLHKLRLSALEAELLYSTFRARLQIRDITRWQQDVLDFWTLDQAANLPMSQFQGVSEALDSAFVDLRTERPKPKRRFSYPCQLDFVGSWDVNQAWP